MSEQLFTIEETKSSGNFENDLREIGPPSRLDRYAPATKEKYLKLLENAALHGDHNLTAAALIDIEGSGIYRYDPGENIKKAKKIRKLVGGYERFISENPDERAMLITPTCVSIMATEGLSMKRSVNADQKRAGLIFNASSPQAESMTFNGHIDRVERFGNQVYYVPLHHIDKFYPAPFWHGYFPGLIIPPITMGREAINELFDKAANRESWSGGTVNRDTSLPYAIWRLRYHDDSLGESIDALADQYGLPEIWAEQYKHEIGAKVAHVILKGYTEENTKRRFGEHLFLWQSRFWDEEYQFFGITDESLIDTAGRHCQRLGVVATAPELEDALTYVTGTSH